MSEQQCLADKILAELPEELAAATRFEGDEKGNLHMFFGFKLADTDFPLVLEVIRRYNGDFANKKDSATGKDVGYFYIPKPKPATSDNTCNAISHGTSQRSATQCPEASAPSTPTVAESEVKASIDAKPEEKKGVPKISDKIRQPSPISQFSNNYCSVCEDLGAKCNSTTSSGREHQALCDEKLMIQTFQNIAVALDKFIKELPNAFVEMVKSAATAKAEAEKSMQQSAKQEPQSVPSDKVQRSTRPTEGHREEGIVWVNDVNAKGEPIEKAFELDNKNSRTFDDLYGKIDEKIHSGKKGLELNGKWYWLYQDKKTIGRKRAKDFAKGGRR